jgi:hypothetical protein
MVVQGFRANHGTLKGHSHRQPLFRGVDQEDRSVCFGLEIDPKYVDVAVERWQGLSGRRATLEGDGRTFDAIQPERAKVAA